jgi:MoxR-like ATPase
VSVGKTTYQLEQPFLVLATQNPLEMEGTYPLPEAQLDRFFFKLKVMYPPEAAMHRFSSARPRRTTRRCTRVMDGPEILEMRHVVRAVPIAKPVQATRSGSRSDRIRIRITPRRWSSVTCGTARVLGARRRWCSPARSTRSRAAMRSCRWRTSAPSRCRALRHRLLLNFEGEAEQVNADTIVSELLAAVPQTAD